MAWCLKLRSLSEGMRVGLSPLTPACLFVACLSLTWGAPVHSQTGSVDGIEPISMVAPELREVAQTLPPGSVNAENLSAVRAKRVAPPIPEGVERREIPRSQGGEALVVYLYDPAPEAKDKPVILHMHGGGYIAGSAALMAQLIPYLAQVCECVVVSVEYRLAPETPFPGALEDNLAALTWIRESADELGIDPNRIAIGGESAGGGHAAQLAIAARDRGIPIAFQLLIYPMLDDRTGSVRKVPGHIGHYVWNEESNVFGWSSYLGQPAGKETVPYGSVPARVQDLSGLAPAWIGVGGVDLFLAENLDYALRLTEAGVPTELLVLPGAIHGFNFYSREKGLAKQFNESWQAALKRALHPSEH